jgi:hypothetical protein
MGLKEFNEIFEKAKEMERGREELHERLHSLLYDQIVDLSMMSKIELGDDVIAEIHRLRNEINQEDV